MPASTSPPMTEDCRDFVAGVEKRAQDATRRARFLPRKERQAFIYDNTFRNDIEAVAYPLAHVLGRVPDFANPTAYCEKMRGLYLTHPNPLMALAADKVDMHRLCDHLDTPIRPPKLYAAYDDPSALDLTTLPETAMLKVSDGCNMNILHGPGLPITPFAYRFFLWKYWHIEHWRRHGELHYRDIPRRIMLEEALLPIESLTETCFFCAFETPYMLLTKHGYAPTKSYATMGGYLALEERLKPIERASKTKKPTFEEACPAQHRDAMFETARLIGAHLPSSRVDFMFHGDHCYLGEITVSSAAYVMTHETQEQEDLRSNLIDVSRLPDCLASARKIAAALDWPTEPSFGHYAPDDPRLATGGQ
ncbi:MAG: ATP-grasp fold amidoligase family protein [Pseudopelagicola sp.]|nr:ATP-grasp fold amidoligase family protein [Pseudopelagicola sp.]